MDTENSKKLKEKSRKKGYGGLLERVIVGNSVASMWEKAVEEWEIYGYNEDELCSETCTCGKQGLRRLFTIRNIENGNILEPIGSSCIHKFERKDLDDDMAVIEQFEGLVSTFSQGKPITIHSFSRRLIEYLYENGAFKANEYNSFDPENDYEFMIKMFNARDWSRAQDLKVKAIITSSIRPYLARQLRDRLIAKQQKAFNGMK
jgi:hypothetical protein